MDDSQEAFRELEDQEESVRIAVKALGNMRNGTANSRTGAQASTSSSPYASSSRPKSPSPSSQEGSSDAASSTPGLVSRMSTLPLVGSAMWAYEQGKASSRVVKYGAEMMESSLQSISRPVIDRLPVQLDEFACRQLDRFDRYRRPDGMAVSPDPSEERGRPRTKTLDGSPDRDVSMDRSRNVPSWLEATSPFVAPPPPPPADARSSTPTQSEQQVAQRSRWQAVLLEAGGLSAALSEDSMRRLKYCLQWLQYATAHIDAQILILRDFTANLQPWPSDSLTANRRPPISEEHMRKLIDVRRDIVHTIRQVVDVVSKYAGGALPEPARGRVRGFILKLPQRWASKAGPGPSSSVAGVGTVAGERETVAAAATGTGAVRRPGGQRRAAHRERGAGSESSNLKSGPSSRAPSPSASPRIPRPSALTITQANGGDSCNSNGSAIVAAQKILVLATESLDMMRNVTGVVKDSLDRADAWVGRLRTVGIQRGAQEGEDTEGEGHSEFDFSAEHLRHRHRRTSSAASTSVFDDDTPPSPFFSGSTSTNWGSSIPSTPGGSGTFSASASYVTAQSPSVMAMSIPIGQMSLGGGSTYNTPRSVVVGLPDEEENVGVDVDGRQELGTTPDSKLFERPVLPGVKVVGVDRGLSEEDGEKKMDVDT